jgi:hypothetical protein
MCLCGVKCIKYIFAIFFFQAMQKFETVVEPIMASHGIKGVMLQAMKGSACMGIWDVVVSFVVL